MQNMAVTDECPKLRRDLRVSEQRTREGIVYVVNEPDSGRFFRLREVEYFIAQQLDGTSLPEDIRRRVEARFGGDLPPEQLEEFLAHIQRLGLLEGAAPASPRGRIRGNLLYLRLKALDPDRPLDRLLPRVRICFTRGFMACTSALVGLGIAVAVANWPDVRQEFDSLYRFNALVYAWFVMLLTISAHELAHGLTCKHFGGRVREMGVMLIYFQPALYCNVTDAWLFPEKAKRLWVTFAGAYLDILLWSLAILAWRATEADTWIHFTALVVVATAGVRMLFNLNPLIKLDGYYLLSDALEIPNLRARASRFLRGAWRRLWSAAGAAAVDETPARERRIFLAYGILAGVYSAVLLGTVALWFGGYLVDRYQGLGFLLFLGVLIMFFFNPLKRSAGLLPERVRSAVASIRSMKRPSTKLVVAALVALLLALPTALTVPGEFAVLPTQNADIRAEVEGVIEAIEVAEGDAVETGAVIARLSNRDRLAELSQVEAAIREKQAKLRMLRAGARAEDIAVLRQRAATARTRAGESKARYAEEKQLHAARLAGTAAGVMKAEEQLKFAQQKLAQMEPLEAAGAVSPLELHEARADVAIRRKAVEEARAALQFVSAQSQAERHQEIALAEARRKEAEKELALLLAGSRPEEVEAMEAEVASLEARRDHLRSQIERASVRSPHAGVVTTPRLKEKIGQHVTKGELIAEVHDLHRITAEIAVPEREIAYVRVGQPVTLRARAYPGETFRGVVTEIAPATALSDKASATRIVRVMTVIDNPDGLLKSQMTGLSKIESDHRPLAEVLGRSLLSPLRVEFWSWW